MSYFIFVTRFLKALLLLGLAFNLHLASADDHNLSAPSSSEASPPSTEPPLAPAEPPATSGEQPLVIEINRGVAIKSNIAIVPFRNESGVLPELLSDIVRADFQLSGQFNIVSEASMLSLPSARDDVEFSEWKQSDTDYLLIGNVNRGDNNRFTIEFSLFDILGERRVTSKIYSFNSEAYRSMAHLIADEVYQEITGSRGSFSTKLAFVKIQRQAGKELHSLIISDADGRNQFTILRSPQPIVSPSWSADGNKLAYVSFEKGRSNIFTQEVHTGERQLVTAFRGVNSAPTWSPDDKSMAIVLSKNDNVDIYIIDLATNKARRITTHPGIDTEPTWSRSGTKMAFTSNRSGQVQIYEYDLEQNTIRQLTNFGSYNSRARYGLNDNALVMISRVDDNYVTAYLDLTDNQHHLISDSNLDDEPTVSPDGNRVAYATKVGNYYRIAVSSIDFGDRNYLNLGGGGDFRSPAWGPFSGAK